MSSSLIVAILAFGSFAALVVAVVIAIAVADRQAVPSDRRRLVSRLFKFLRGRFSGGRNLD
jgi:uncharacterized membrane protein